jgi:tetratricopeptide (TPR) repeat protein
MAKRSRKNKVESRASAKVTAAELGVRRAPSWFRRDWFWGLILILLVILVYTPVWKAGFVWDDETILTTNPCIVGPLGLTEIWTTSYANICPLTLTTFLAEHALWALNPLPYHLVNVLLHGACAILLWQVLRSLRVQGAWLGAALWALHPVMVESVAWITEMKNTQSGLFFLLSILFFIRYLRAKGLAGRTGSGWDYALTLLFAALAMASKSSTVILPVVLCLCGWWFDGRWHWRNLARVAPMFLMALAASAVSIWTQGLDLASTGDPQFVRTWPERLGAAGHAVWFYLGKLLWPHPLVTIYPRWQIATAQWDSYLALLAMIVILFIFWLNRQSWSRACFFAFAYFLVSLLPVLGLIDNPIFRLSLVFDHLQYLASIGPLALAGAGLALFSNFSVPKKPWLQSSLCAGLLLILGIASWQRTSVYESNETFWTDTLAKNPNCWAGYNNLGEALHRKGQLDEAVTQYQKALVIFPNYPEARNNLGNVLLRMGQVDEAIAQYQKALVIRPDYVSARNDLGVALLHTGRLDEAVAQFQKALEINPSHMDARDNLGAAFIQKGQLDEAITQFQEVLRLKPDFRPAQDNLAMAQALVRQRDGYK